MHARNLQARLAQTIPGTRLEATPLPLTPELRLWLLSADFPRGPLHPDVARAVIERPAYWAFCWASGQVLARELLDHPERVRGRRVMDFGAGSGVAGIAAAMAGATEVLCCDLDEDARLACQSNAELNRVSVQVIEDWRAAGEIDLLIIADVLYDRANLPLLNELCRNLRPPADILLADSRIRPEDLRDWTQYSSTQADTIPDLDESPLFRTVRLYRPRSM